MRTLLNAVSARPPARLLAPGLLVLLLAALPAVAWGQNVGTLAGYVYDQSGTPLKGVTITITSPTQIGGPKTDTTNDEGAFRFSGLIPGRFRVSAAAPKLRSTVAENVRVTPAATTDIDLVMEVDTGNVQELTIIDRGPPINQRSSAVGESFDAEFLDTLPLPSRDYQGVATLAAGVTDLANDGNPQVRGGTYFANQYKVDGFNTTDPVTSTFGQNFSFTAMANVEVTTAGGDADMAGVGGGLINVVTKSGSNRFEFDSSIEYTDQNFRFFEDTGENKLRLGQVNLGVGGPILRDKIWYYVSAQAFDNVLEINPDVNFAPHPPLHQYGTNVSGKITWQVSPRNKLALRALANPMVIDNAVQDLLVEPDAETRAFQRSEQVGVSWESQITDDLFLNSRLGYFQQALETRPQSCDWDPVGCRQKAARVDVLSGLQTQNSTEDSLEYRKRVEFSGHTEYSQTTRRFGDHLVRFAWEAYLTQNEIRNTQPGDYLFRDRGPLPFQRIEYCSNDPGSAEGLCRRDYLRSLINGNSSLLSLSDSYKPTRYLTIKPGIAFQTGNSENDKGEKVTDITAFTPHLATTWDPTHDGKSKLQMSFRTVADTGFLALARFSSRQLYSKQCSWDERTSTYSLDCRASGGNDSNTIGLPCGKAGLNPDGTPCRSELNAPKVYELVGTAEREAFTGIVVGSRFIYRRFVRQWEDVETNANWNEGGTALRREAPFKTGESEFVFDLQTPDAAKRYYRGADVYLRKDQGRLKARLVYTWSRYEGSSDTSYAGLYLDNPGQTKYFYGPLATDYRHEVKAQGSYSINAWLSLGLTYQFHSGGPYNRYFLDPVFGSFSRFQANRGYDWSGTLDPTDDRALRMPDISVLNFKVQATLEPLIKQRIDIWADIFNVLNLRTTTSVIQTDGPFWGRSASRLGSTRLSVGARYRF